MSAGALNYVKALCGPVRAGGAPRGRLSPSERAVLRSIALMHDERVGCAYASVDTIAGDALMHATTARAQMRSLERKGLLVRHGARRTRDGGQMANEYELPGLVRWAETGQLAGWDTAEASTDVRQVSTAPDEATRGAEAPANTAETQERVRRQVFRIARRRVPALQLGKQAEGGGELCVPELLPVPQAVQNGFACSPGGQATGARQGGEEQVLAHDVKFEASEEKMTHPVGFPPGETVQKALTNAKAKAGATAGAKAKATTGVALEPEPAARPNPAATRPEPAATWPVRHELAGSAGSDAQLLAAEAAWVLVQCGVMPSASTRRMRAAVEEALAAWMSDTHGSLADAGALAVRRWREHADALSKRLVLFPCGVRNFFGHGLWLQVSRWPWRRPKAF